MKNILIIGLDGVGKTTHAKKLLKELTKRGIRTRYVYMRGYGRVFFAVPFLVISRLLGLTRVHKLDNGNKVSEYFFFTNNFYRIIWPWICLIDSFLYTLLFYHIYPLHKNTHTVSDRSVIDTLVDVIVDTRSKYYFKHYGRFFLSILPKNSMVIMLDVDERIALQRKKDIPSLTYLKMRRDIYQNLAKKYGWTVINTDTDFNIVHNKILSTLFSTASF